METIPANNFPYLLFSLRSASISTPQPQRRWKEVCRYEDGLLTPQKPVVLVGDATTMVSCLRLTGDWKERPSAAEERLGFIGSAGSFVCACVHVRVCVCVCVACRDWHS